MRRGDVRLWSKYGHTVSKNGIDGSEKNCVYNTKEKILQFSYDNHRYIVRLNRCLPKGGKSITYDFDDFP